MDSSSALMRICSYPPFNDGSSLTVGGGGFLHVSSQHQWNTRASSSSSFSTDEKKRKEGSHKSRFKKEKVQAKCVCVTSWVGVMEASGEDQRRNLLSYLRTSSFVGRRGRGGREGRRGGEEFGLATKLWQKQTGCTILSGRFNYK